MERPELIQELQQAYDEYIHILSPYEHVLERVGHGMPGGGSGGYMPHGAMLGSAGPGSFGGPGAGPMISLPLPHPRDLQRLPVLRELISELRKEINNAPAQVTEPAGREEEEVPTTVRSGTTSVAGAETVVTPTSARAAFDRFKAFYGQSEGH